MCNKKLEKIDKRLGQLKGQMNRIGAMRPGSLSRQARRSKKAYGAYWHLSYTHRGCGHTHYVRNELVDTIRQEINNYRRFKKVLDLYLDLSIERSKLWLKLMKYSDSK